MFRTAVVVVDDARIAHTRDGARNEGANNTERERDEESETQRERARQGEKLGLIKKEKEGLTYWPCLKKEFSTIFIEKNSDNQFSFSSFT